MSGELSIYNLEEVVCFFEFLDDLRASGGVHMPSAAPNLVKEFGFSKEKAEQVLKIWTKTYNVKDSSTRRASVAYKFYGQP